MTMSTILGAHTPAPLAIPTNIKAAVSFLVRPLTPTIFPAIQVGYVQVLLRQNLALAMTSSTPTLVLSFFPNRLPPTAILAAAHAARIDWVPWMAVLAPIEFDLVIRPEEVRVAYRGLRPREEVIWMGESTPVVLLSGPAVPMNVEGVLPISRYARGVLDESRVSQGLESKADSRLPSCMLRETLASARARVLKRTTSSREDTHLPQATLALPTLMSVPAFEAPPPQHQSKSCIYTSQPYCKPSSLPVPTHKRQPQLQSKHIRTRTLAQELLEATHDEDATEIFAQLDRVTAEGILSPTPTHTSFPQATMRRFALPLSADYSTEEEDSSPVSSRPSSRASTTSTTSISSSTAHSEISTSTAASSIDSALFLLEPKGQSHSAPYVGAYTRRLPLAGIEIAHSMPCSHPAPGLQRAFQSRFSISSDATPVTITPVLRRRVNIGGGPSSTHRPRLSSSLSTGTKPAHTRTASPLAPTVDISKAEKTKYLYAGGVSTVLGGGVMLGSRAPRTRASAPAATAARAASGAHLPSSAERGPWMLRTLVA